MKIRVQTINTISECLSKLVHCNLYISGLYLLSSNRYHFVYYVVAPTVISTACTLLGISIHIHADINTISKSFFISAHINIGFCFLLK